MFHVNLDGPSLAARFMPAQPGGNDDGAGGLLGLELWSEFVSQTLLVWGLDVLS